MATEAPLREKSLRELRKSDLTLYAKNNTNKMITCNSPDGKISIHLPPGDLKGLGPNIVPVTKEVLDMPGFQKLWMLKKITVSDDESMEDELMLLMGGAIEVDSHRIDEVAKMGAAQTKSGDPTIKAPTVTVEESSTTRDIHVGETGVKVGDESVKVASLEGQPKCLFCSEPVFQSIEDNRAGVPPLCETHIEMAPEYVGTLNPDGRWAFVRPAVDVTQRVETINADEG